MIEDTLYRYNPWWEKEETLTGFVKRPRFQALLAKHLHDKRVIFITGLRRVGKTTLMKLFIHDLIHSDGILPSHILYASMDDYLLSKHTLLQIIEEYRKTHKIRFREKVYLFLDEIAHQKDFELQLKNLVDSQNVKVYASSSSASILKSKKPYLTGRNVVFEVLPLDFKEYLEFKEISLSKSDSPLLEKYFEEYLCVGGMPEYVLRGDVEYLKELVDDVIYKDIVAAYNIREPQNLKDFFLLLMERAGKTASLNKMSRILNLSADTARRYLQMFEDTFLIYTVPRCGKTNEKILSPKKVYASDLGIRTFFTGFRDKGSLFENYVYLRIKNSHPCYVYKDGIEIDFMTDDKTLIEVKYQAELNEKQKRLFEGIKAQKKMVIKSVYDLEKLNR